jgi:hypothetical protein
MASRVDRVDVWKGTIADSPGELGKVLKSLREAGANLEFLFARPWKEGQSAIFLAPLQGAAQIRAAKSAGIVKWAERPSLRIRSANKAGLAAKIASALGAAGINIHGLSAIGDGNRSVFYLALKKADIAKAQRAVKKVL